MLLDQIDWRDPADIADWLHFLHRKLIGRYGHVDDHLLDGSIEDALLHYQSCPGCFDATRGVPLSYYLALWTRSYLDRKLRKMKRRRKHERAVGVWDKQFEKIVSEARREKCIYSGKDEIEQESEERREEVIRQKEALDAIVADLNPHDRAGVDLLRIGASVETWVQHLGIERLPQREQQHAVNREKERLIKKLKRRAQKMPGGARSQDRTQVRATCFDASGERESWLRLRRMLQSKQGKQRFRMFPSGESLLGR